MKNIEEEILKLLRRKVFDLTKYQIEDELKRFNIIDVVRSIDRLLNRQAIQFRNNKYSLTNRGKLMTLEAIKEEKVTKISDSILEVKSYKTKDGKLFFNKIDAEKHNVFLKIKYDLQNFFESNDINKSQHNLVTHYIKDWEHYKHDKAQR